MSTKAVAAAVFVVVLTGCDDARPPIETADYASLNFPNTCNPRQRTGLPGATDALTTSRGIRINVRAPTNYDRTRAHPLLIVYAPAGFTAKRSEQHAKLTTEATRQGFVVAFPDHRPLAMSAFDALAEVSNVVMNHWCIDEHRVYFAGHSDGGTTAAAITFLSKSKVAPTSILVSGAGIRDQDLAQYPCPAPVNVTVLHSREDELFPLPAYGKGASQWWVRCNGCDTRPSAPDPEGCVVYSRCLQAVTTRYCESNGAHRHWPASATQVLRLLQAGPAATKAQ